MIDESDWTLWRAGATLDSFDDFVPELASWDHKEAKSQVRLQAYLDDVVPKLRAVSPIGPHGFLNLEVGIESADRLLTGCDLENYLTPLFGRDRLSSEDFVLVTAKKRVGRFHLMSIGQAVPGRSGGHDRSWSYWGDPVGSGYESEAWKCSVRDRLQKECPQPLGPGPVELRVIWRSGAGRNWKNLWKPTCDSMGPVLGYGPSGRTFDPQDDRVTTLAFHHTVEPSKGHDIDVGMWWRLAPDRK